LPASGDDNIAECIVFGDKGIQQIPDIQRIILASDEYRTAEGDNDLFQIEPSVDASGRGSG